MNYSIQVREEALQETIDAVTYYEDKQVGLGQRFLDTVLEYFEKIRQRPEAYPKKTQSIREAYIQAFPFVIVYEIFEDLVIVYSVFNAYQNPDKKVRNG